MGSFSKLEREQLRILRNICRVKYFPAKSLYSQQGLMQVGRSGVIGAGLSRQRARGQVPRAVSEHTCLMTG